MTAGLRPGETSEQCTTQTATRLHLPESPLPTTLSPGYLLLVRVNCVKHSTASSGETCSAGPSAALEYFWCVQRKSRQADQQSQGTPMSRGVVSFLGSAARRARRFTRLTADAVAARVSASRKERSFGGNVEKVSPLRAQPPRVSGRGPERGGEDLLPRRAPRTGTMRDHRHLSGLSLTTVADRSELSPSRYCSSRTGHVRSCSGRRVDTCQRVWHHSRGSSTGP